MAHSAALFVCYFMFSVFIVGIAQDKIEPHQVIRDGQTVVSSGGIFELGFFSPDGVSTRYFGVWYKNVTPRTVVWVANREVPLAHTSGAVNFTSQGHLILLNHRNEVVWSSNVSRIAQDPIAQLLDSGNFVVRDRADNDPDDYLWQSFDYICDSFLPGMKLGVNFVTGWERYMSSWKSPEDPSPGEYSVHVDTRGFPQILNERGSKIQFRPGSWNGITWTGTPYLSATSGSVMEFVFNEKEVYFKFKALNNTALTRYTLYSTGFILQYTWDDMLHDWMIVAAASLDRCENYALCGEYGSCNINSSAICTCLVGYTPKAPRQWNSADWSGGCVRRTPLDCNATDGFLKLSGMKLPDTSSTSWLNNSISQKECESLCRYNCSCTAYANLDIRGSGCLLWFGKLVDTRTQSEGGQDLYIRVAASELGSSGTKRSGQKLEAAVIAGSIMLAAIMVVLGTILSIYRKCNPKPAMGHKMIRKTNGTAYKKEDMEMPIFDLHKIADATNNFSNINKLGEGGFGPVYKGILAGQEIAVKRLSRKSDQGINEFKNEVTLIAKLQHRNLVRLLGCCIHDNERMLIYEYMPNRGLDSFIFDKAGRKFLDWKKRIHIIDGIARGLLYLHQDSRLRIIHRDLKASNILLDSNMNPKISDFGLARTFGADQTEANTDRVVGTYGYMSPEYAVDGLFSVKSDVFSFGVLVLEIVSGRKNRGFFHADHDLNLLGHAWVLWNKGIALDLIDECLADSFVASEALRCIQVGLLCVQQRPEDRPVISTVVLMMGSQNPLPTPKKPGFFMGRNRPDDYSATNVTITAMEGR